MANHIVEWNGWETIWLNEMDEKPYDYTYSLEEMNKNNVVKQMVEENERKPIWLNICLKEVCDLEPCGWPLVVVSRQKEEDGLRGRPDQWFDVRMRKRKARIIFGPWG